VLDDDEARALLEQHQQVDSIELYFGDKLEDA
jgi:hypothetical protein